MWTGFHVSRRDLDRTLAEMGTLQREIEHLFDGYAPANAGETRHVGWDGVPEAALSDAGDAIVLEAVIPGLGPDDIELHVTANGVTLSGERKSAAPEGYRTHRKERRAFHFSRSFNLPIRVDPERVVAEVKNGILTVKLPKAAEVQPRKISIQA